MKGESKKKEGVLDDISLRGKVALFATMPIILTFFVIQSFIVFGYLEPSLFWAKFGYGCVILFMPPFFLGVSEFLYRKRKIREALTNKINDFEDFQGFVNQASIVTKADKRAKITFVNEKFEKVAGYTSEEVLGRDHIIVNSGTQPPKYWRGMYQKVQKGEVWHDVVTNRAKDGSLYYVDTYIKATFDKRGEISGYISLRQDVTEIINSQAEITKKNTYLEHAAKIIRHDMHSGINTYLPRGIRSLRRRLTEEDIKRLKIGSPLQLIEDGLHHAQKVYSGVYEFTNLVKNDAQMSVSACNIKHILDDYLRLTAYKSQVILDNSLPKNLMVNEPLFCTAIDNLIRNGLKYNDSPTKFVKIYFVSEAPKPYIAVEDNGRGLTQKEFEELSKPYARKEGQKEGGTGLGLNITIEILKEHGFEITICDVKTRNDIGTKLKIELKDD